MQYIYADFACTPQPQPTTLPNHKPSPPPTLPPTQSPKSLHPLLPCLRPYSTRRAQSMVASSLIIAGVLNYIVAM